MPLLTDCCCSRCVGDSVAGKDGDAPAAMPVCAAETTQQTAAGESDDIMRAREASLFCFLFNSRSTRTTGVCTVCRRFRQLKGRGSARFALSRLG